MTRKDTNALREALAGHYSDPEWFLTFEVPHGNRLIDAVAVSRIDSRGNEVHAIEVKSDRSDWLRELADPYKADGWGSVCDRFYLCAGKGVAMLEELPAGWGLLEPMGQGLHETRTAVLSPWREASGSDPMHRRDWVFLLRRALGSEEGLDPLLAKAYDRGRKAAVLAGTEDLRREAQDAKRNLGYLQEKVVAFEKVSGFKVADGWHREPIGPIIEAALAGNEIVRTAAYSLRNVQRELDRLREALAATGWKDGEAEE